MDLQEYQQKALRTESVVDSINVNPDLLEGALELFIFNCELLDAIKKSVFYGKDTKLAELLSGSVHEMLGDTLNGVQDGLDNLSEKYDIPVDPRLFHSVLGIATESGEMVEALLPAINSGDAVDLVNLWEEFGDLNWYQAIGHDAFKQAGVPELSWVKGLQTNIDKLQARYPEKFTQDNATNRDLDKERKVLENGNV